jgi:ribonuclease HI
LHRRCIILSEILDKRDTACAVEDIEKSCTCGNICILSDSQPTVKAFECFQINSKLVWDCHQSMLKLAEHKRIQLIWVPEHMLIDGNEIAEQLASKAPDIHLWYLSLALAYLQWLPGE